MADTSEPPERSWEPLVPKPALSNGNPCPRTAWGTQVALGMGVAFCVVGVALILNGWTSLKGPSRTGGDRESEKNRAPSVSSVAADDSRVMAPEGAADELSQAKSGVETGSPDVSAIPLPPRIELPIPTDESRGLMRVLCEVDPALGPMTPERAEVWRAALEQLGELGVDGVAAIAEFLGLNRDVMFDAEGAEALGARSLRFALLETLTRMGGAEAMQVLFDTLGVTANPREIGLIARNLDRLAPGQYRHPALTAAREALQMAMRGELTGWDVGPVFEVMKEFGAGRVVKDLEGAARQWKNYAVLSLAQLPDGAGVPSLVRMAQPDASGRPGPNRDAAFEMLVQVSPKDSEAWNQVIGMARSNRLATPSLRSLFHVLSGEEVRWRDPVFVEHGYDSSRRTRTAYVAWGNQSFAYVAPEPGGDPAAKALFQRRLELIHALRETTQDPDALQVLGLAEEALRRR